MATRVSSLWTSGAATSARAGRYSRHSLFYRFLLTYLIVLFVPIFILTFFQYVFYFDILKTQILNEKQQSLERSAELIEQQFSQLRKIVLRMSLSSDFRPFNFDAVPYDGYAFVRAIGDYVYDDSFSESIFVHFNGDAHVYTSFNALRVGEFVAERLGSPRVFDEIMEARSGYSFHASGRQIVLASAFPSGRPQDSYGKIMFFFDRSLLLSFFSDPDTVYEIHDPDGQTIFVSREDIPPPNDDVVLTYRSSGGLVYESRISTRLISGDLLHYRNAYLAVVAFILVVSFPLVYYVAVTQFDPIRKLTQFVRQVTGSSPNPNEPRRRNELELIHDDIDDFVHKINPAVKTQLVYDLLNGKIENTARIFERSREMELKWEATRHTVMIVRNREDAARRAGWIQSIEARIRQKAQGAVEEVLVHESPQDRQTVFILGFSDELTRSDIRELLGGSIDRPCGCGSPKQSPELLNAAYAEAQRAAEYCLLSGSPEVVFYDEIGDERAAAPCALLDELNAALERGDLERAEGEFNQLQRVIGDSAFSLFDIKMVYYELLNMAVRINEKWQYPDTFQIENTDSIEEVLRLIRKIVTNALERQEAADPVPDFVNRLQLYIDENYTNCLLSLKLLEDESGYSLAYISRSFKRYKRINISAYITNLRMNRAKELLRYSNLPIHDIITSVGYSDSSSFSRNFRKHEGISPGEYRGRHLLTKGARTIDRVQVVDDNERILHNHPIQKSSNERIHYHDRSASSGDDELRDFVVS